MWPLCSLAGSKGAAEGKADDEFSLETQASFFLSFAVERTWFLVQMSMEKVTTALPLSHQAHIVRYDVSADATS